MSLTILVLMLLGWPLAWLHAASAAGPAIRIAAGTGSFLFVDEKGDPSKPMTIYTYLPKRLAPGSAPIVFVIHGHGKNAKGNRDIWVEHADRYSFMVIAPLFDPEHWRGGEYSYAGVVGRDGKIQDASRWSVSVVEHLFDAIKASTGNKSSTYFIYGHSQGGQFVHRLVLFLPDARYARAVAANSGWYTMPRFDVKFPYGLRGSPVTESSLTSSLGRELVVLLGDRDTDPNHEDLRRTPEAMAQGAHRFARGHRFFTEARDRTGELKTTFRWQLRVVPGAAHENSRMSRPAAEALMGR